ncbi:hypothetical protein [Pseudobacter ginsenosidimutans]|uniref:SH3 domain-containing protein n=1 Tax=Pseudobacter ginsenosidimutans TaxID=661488 RepID=A0A4Q7N646_9BACT|nr:hypothetical protein [Pseudobacter ginsenosidimutans]QEC45050.1 hypothetical protein FSB84_26440 [Pseudobacter ginsenosidimutans]RZS76545.1 hypothetical protein EV199_2431 [Pseudobacter ginsenosidimutans]
MKALILTLLTVSSIIAKGQSIENFPDMRTWGIYYTDTVERYIFADTAYIRISPDTKQSPIDTLFAGDNILVTGASANALTIRGIKGPWLKIKYVKNGEEKNGYIWQGLISCTPLRRGDLKFVFGIERRADSSYTADNRKENMPRYLVRLKVVQNGKIITRSSLITNDNESANFCDGKVMSGLGLTNVQNIVVISFSGAACGIPTLDYYFAFTKNNTLVRFPDKMNVGYAGAYYHEEKFIFPAEKNGKPDLLFWSMTEEEATDKTDQNGEPVMRTIARKNKTYTWNSQEESITETKK